MSAYVVVEATVRDPEARDRYGSQIGPVLKQFSGEILAFGPWQLLFGEPAYHNGMIIRFPDKDTALAWYNSPAYQALLDIRDAALDSQRKHRAKALGRYQRPYEIAENRSLACKIVALVAGGDSRVPPPPSELCIVIRRERKAA